MGETSIEMLVRRAARAEPEAFALLVERVRERLTMWISVRMGPLLRSRLSEEDVLQETLLHAFRSLPDFEPAGEDSFRKWIFAVAENRLKDLHKHHAAQKRDPGREVAAANADEARLLERISTGGTSPSSGAHRRELLDRLRDRIEELPAPEQEVLLLRTVRQCNVREIAERVDKSVRTVHAIYARALEKLRHGLAGS